MAVPKKKTSKKKSNINYNVKLKFLKKNSIMKNLTNFKYKTFL